MLVYIYHNRKQQLRFNPYLMLAELSIARFKMFSIKSLLLEIMTSDDAEDFYAARYQQFKGKFIYTFKVQKKKLIWKINKRLIDFEILATRVNNKLGVDFSNFGSQGDLPEQTLFKKLEDYINLCISQGNSLAAVMLQFLQQSGHAYDGLEKYKQVEMLKKAGGRFQQSCSSCGGIFKGWKLRHFIIHNEGLIYKDQFGFVKEYLSYDYDFKMTYGKVQTSDELGIVLTSTHRKLKLKALNLFDWIQFIYYVKIGFKACEYVNINRYSSFAPVRTKCNVKFLIDGEQYFSSVATSLMQAKKEVFITDWWLSPQFYMLRPITEVTKEFRLDKIFQRIAKRGVKVHIIVYHQSTFLANDSLYTKTYLESLHSNIKVLRHPATVLPTLWSHHQKLVIIDQSIGYLGGLDLCYGRWDTQNHQLFDVEKNVYPGIQYNNIRSQDIINVKDFQSQQYERQKARLPWHDVACFVQGEAVWDLSRHFIQYWNYASFQKQGNDRQLLMRDPSKKPGLIKRKLGQGLQKLIDIKNKIKQKLQGHSPDKQTTRMHAYVQKTLNQSVNQPIAKNKNIYEDARQRTQSYFDLDRLASSHNIKGSMKNHNNIQIRPKRLSQSNMFLDNRYVKMLNHIIQPGEEQNDQHEISFRQILNQNKNHHKVYEDQIQHQQKPIAYKQLQTNSFGTMQCQIVRSVGPWSIGCSKQSTQCSIQVAYIQLIANSKYYIYIQNQFFMSSCANPSIIKNQIANALVLRIRKAVESGQKFRVIVMLPLLPGFAGEVDDPEAKILKLQMYWQYQTICRGKNSLIEQLKQFVPNPFEYIKFLGLRTHKRLSNQHTPVTQIIYVHSKLMIVDDQYVILGSANINDRSMKGKRDSQICMVSQDTQRILTMMNNQRVQVGKNCSIFRKRLFQQHFDFKTQQQLDPLSDNNWIILSQVALQNTEIYRHVFSCYPDDEVKQLSELPLHKNKCYIQRYEQLKKSIKGNVVEYPLKFLQKEYLNLKITQKEYLMPVSFAT